MVTAVTTIARLCTLVSRSELTAWVPISVSIVHLKPCDYPVIENGKISERMAHSYFPMRIGQYVDYHCRNGYLAPNGGRVVRIYCSKGGWNPEPKCLKTCFVTHLENGYFRYNRYTYTEGERIQYVCNQDYRTESAGGEVTCTKNGWSPFPRCIRKSESPMEKCDSPPPIANGALKLPPLAQYESGSSVQYSCYDYHFLQGSERIYCSAGQWTSPPVCIEPCTLSKNEMEKNNVLLEGFYENQVYFYHGDYVGFYCKWNHFGEESGTTLFQVQCKRGQLAYPRCVERGELQERV
uniref:Sushi domain-containing protein n=1 Tax=Anas platyrhynchos TaxID=8839 RepID=A0A8B9T8Y5_ANAPL